MNTEELELYSLVPIARNYVYDNLYHNLDHINRIVSKCNNNKLKIVAYLHDANLSEKQLVDTFSDEIVESILLLNSRVSNRNTYYRRIRRNNISRNIKIIDLKDHLNIDISNLNKKERTKYDQQLKYLNYLH